MRKLFLFFAIALMAGQVMAQKSVRQYRRAAKEQLKSIEALQDRLEDQGVSRSPLAWDLVYQQFEEAQAKGEEMLRSGLDVVLHPIESVDFSAVMPEATQGDWGDQYMGLEDRYKEIYDKAIADGRPVRIVTFDTGKADHDQLNDLIDQANGKNWTNSADELDRHSHATHCKGIQAGADKETKRDAVADAKKMELGWEKVLNDDGGGAYSWITEATKYENGISEEKFKAGYFVIYSYSLGGGASEYKPLEQAFQAALDLGVVIVVAAGNNGQYVTYPGKSDKVQAIAALQRDGSLVKRASYSGKGPEVWGSTPGSYVYSTILNNEYGYKSGTSMATPYMARIIATLACINPEATGAQILAHLEKNGTDLPPTGVDEETGWGWPVVDQLLQPIGGEPDPDPDPDPPTDPVKPARDLIIPGGEYSVQWKPSKEPDFRRLYFEITLEAKSKTLAEITIDEVLANVEDHFRSRWYLLSHDADIYDACFYVAYFYRLIEKDEVDAMPIMIRGWDQDGREVILTEKDLKRVRGIKSLWLKMFGPKVYSTNN